MDSTTTLTLVDGVRIIVPDSLNLITTYVLREREDWFEDEIKFLRQFLKPGDRVIDIGANYGVYTLSMAKLVGPAGRVWAFEPASSTAKLLAASIAANDFSQVELTQNALSREKGGAELALNENSELNALVRDNISGSETETADVTTLDTCLAAYGWEDIQFLKLDAEGEEENILRGGLRFFESQSPLVQYKIKAGAQHDMELIRSFAELGYNSYRLVPGLNVLMPFSETGPVDTFLLNLFSCKPDRTARLADEGFLVTAEAVLHSREAENTGRKANPDRNQSNSWLPILMNLPYAKACAKLWQETIAANGNREVQAALSSYMISRDASLTAAERFSALEDSYLLLKSLCESQPTYLRLSSLARVACDYGARELAVKALNALCNVIFQQRRIDPREPFLAPGERFDSVPPRSDIRSWVAAAALEELERLGHFSSFYTGRSALRRLEVIRDMGFGSAEMNRRLKLVQQRFSTGST